MKKKRNFLTIISSILGVFTICSFCMFSIFGRSDKKANSVDALSYVETTQLETGYNFRYYYDTVISSDNEWYIRNGYINFNFIQGSIVPSIEFSKLRLRINGDLWELTPTSTNHFQFDAITYSNSLYRIYWQYGQLIRNGSGNFRFNFNVTLVTYNEGSYQTSSTSQLYTISFSSNDVANYSTLNFTSSLLLTNTIFIQDEIKQFQDTSQSSFFDALSVKSMPFISMDTSYDSFDFDNVLYKYDFPSISSTYTSHKIAICDGSVSLKIKNFNGSQKKVDLSISASYLRLDNEVITISEGGSYSSLDIEGYLYESNKSKLYLRIDEPSSVGGLNVCYLRLYFVGADGTFTQVTKVWQFRTDTQFVSSSSGLFSQSDFVVDYYQDSSIYKNAYDYAYGQGYSVGQSEGSQSYQDGYVNGYNIGFAEAENFYTSTQVTVYNNGYNAGYSEGYVAGEESVNVGEIGLENYQAGYSDGFAAADSQDEVVTSIFSGILQVAMVPVNFFLGIFNFEILGINLSAFIRAIFTVVLTIIVLKTVMGKGGGSSDN